jgi:hypothetical protein
LQCWIWSNATLSGELRKKSFEQCWLIEPMGIPRWFAVSTDLLFGALCRIPSANLGNGSKGGFSFAGGRTKLFIPGKSSLSSFYLMQTFLNWENWLKSEFEVLSLNETTKCLALWDSAKWNLLNVNVTALLPNQLSIQNFW